MDRRYHRTGVRRRAMGLSVLAGLLIVGGAASGDLLGPGSPGISANPPSDVAATGSRIPFDRDIGDYVLFALERIDLKGDSGGELVEGELRGGHVGVNAHGTAARGVPRLSMCQGSGEGRVTRMDEGSQVVADTAAIASRCYLWDVKVGQPTARVTPHARSLTFRTWYDDGIPSTYDWPTDLLRANDDTITTTGELPPLPPLVEGSDPTAPATWSPCVAGTRTTIKNGRLAPPAGDTELVLGDLLLDGTVTVRAGTYTVCDLKLDRSTKVLVDPGVELRVWGDLLMPSGGQFGTPASRATKVTVAGESVRFGRNRPVFAGRLWAPRAQVNLGNGTHVYGRLWAREFISDWNVSINEDICPSVGTTTAPCEPHYTTTTQAETSTTEGGN